MEILYNLLKMLNNSTNNDGLKVLILVFGYSLALVLIGCLANYITNTIINNSKFKKV